MKDANGNDQGKSAQQSDAKENIRNRGAEKRPGNMNVPGSTVVHDGVPADPNDIIHEDDLLQSDIADEEVNPLANPLESALDEAKARGELREMPAMTEVIKRERESEKDSEKEP